MSEWWWWSGEYYMPHTELGNEWRGSRSGNLDKQLVFHVVYLKVVHSSGFHLAFAAQWGKLFMVDRWRRSQEEEGRQRRSSGRKVFCVHENKLGLVVMLIGRLTVTFLDVENKSKWKASQRVTTKWNVVYIVFASTVMLLLVPWDLNRVVWGTAPSSMVCFLLN